MFKTELAFLVKENYFGSIDIQFFTFIFIIILDGGSYIIIWFRFNHNLWLRRLFALAVLGTRGTPKRENF